MKKTSETLLRNNEFFNSCYAAGYVIECYAKIVLEIAYGDEQIIKNSLKKEYGHELKN